MSRQFEHCAEKGSARAVRKETRLATHENRQTESENERPQNLPEHRERHPERMNESTNDVHRLVLKFGDSSLMADHSSFAESRTPTRQQSTVLASAFRFRQTVSADLSDR